MPSQNLPGPLSFPPHVWVRVPCECQSPLCTNQPGLGIRGWLEGHLGGPLPLLPSGTPKWALLGGGPLPLGLLF